MSGGAQEGFALGLTIPLQRFLRVKTPPPAAAEDLRLCWDLHLLRPGGAPALFMVHASSRFAVLLHRPTLAGWQDLPALTAQALARVLAAEGLPPALCQWYTAGVGAARQTKTHGRRPVAFLNRAVDDLYALPAAPDTGALEQPLLDMLLNDVPCRAAGHEGVGTARAFLHNDMRRLWQQQQ